MIDVPQAKELFERGDVAFVDVRAPSEFALGHIPGAVNLSAVSALSKDSLFSVCAEGDPVAFYCHGKHCMLSAYAAAKAILWGYRDVYYFAEGFPGWESAGLSIEADNK